MPEVIEIRVKLFADLADYLPQELDGRPRVHNELPVRVAREATVAEVLARFAVPQHKAHLVLVNGVFVPPGERARRTLAAGDALAVWPPIAGG